VGVRERLRSRRRASCSSSSRVWIITTVRQRGTCDSTASFHQGATRANKAAPGTAVRVLRAFAW
jgi:hypothetical protein